MTTALAPYHLPHAIENTILAHVARSAFISGADLGLLIAAVLW
jgi:hypothetical protein